MCILPAHRLPFRPWTLPRFFLPDEFYGHDNSRTRPEAAMLQAARAMIPDAYSCGLSGARPYLNNRASGQGQSPMSYRATSYRIAFLSVLVSGAALIGGAVAPTIAHAADAPSAAIAAAVADPGRPDADK